MQRPLLDHALSAVGFVVLLGAAACATSVNDSAAGPGARSNNPSGPASGSDETAPGNEDSPANEGKTLGDPPTPPTAETTCDGLDDNANGVIDEGCPCTAGETRACYDGPLSTRNVGTCADGTQSCELSGEFGAWGACVGSVGPQADVQDGKDNDCDGTPDNSAHCGADQDNVPESCTNGVDDDCDGKPDCLDPDCAADASCDENCSDGTDNDRDGQIDCADTDCTGASSCQENCGDGTDNDHNGRTDCDDDACANAPNCREDCHDGIDNDNDTRVDCDDPDCEGDVQCKSDECSAGGTVYVNNLWYCSLGTNAYGIHLWSGMAWGVNQACGADFGTGGTFTAKCAGTYDVCARVVSKTTNCTLTTQCVTVFVPTDNGTVSLPPFPGFSDKTGACADSMYPYGGKTCIDVAGTTVDNIPVSRDNVVCLAEFTFGSGTGGDSGGGSY